MHEAGYRIQRVIDVGMLAGQVRNGLREFGARSAERARDGALVAVGFGDADFDDVGGFK